MRTLKISEKAVNRKYGKIKKTPSLLITGEWFRKLNFSTGDKVEITEEQNRIIIKKV